MNRKLWLFTRWVVLAGVLLVTVPHIGPDILLTQSPEAQQHIQQFLSAP